MEHRRLTPKEESVIIYKGTEMPFTGEYYKHKKRGTYVCKRCGAPLYRSEDKFESHCGWPSFDDEIPGAVKRETDSDGVRVEILCNSCGAHLGHVFEGEKFTKKDVRHCVNSISLDFVPGKDGNGAKKAIFAGGCFWGLEHYFKDEKGVISTRVGYIGGNKDNPTYKEVCSDKTGHAEAIEVTYDPSQTTYEDLARLFFEIHDPEQIDRQGPDIGKQYRSAIFYLDEEQKEISQKLIKILEEKGYRVATTLEKAGTFYQAEDYHQKYYQNTGKQPYCHIRREKF
ncbi:MAG: bifunctional methionine sulfoxide reductase B/A protein [Halobacteriota archaeon]|nr:bifunctional methionine sulfoxide reductase B/A protein [Halobacteriota archaeon]